MKPQTIGRALGIGLRVAGRIAGERLSASASSSPVSFPSSGASQALPPEKPAVKRISGAVTRGVGGFLRPVRRAGGILWLELTGSFFLLFALVFAAALWRIRASYAQGPEHGKFLADAAVAAVFLYLGVTSFWRAGKR